MGKMERRLLSVIQNNRLRNGASAAALRVNCPVRPAAAFREKRHYYRQFHIINYRSQRGGLECDRFLTLSGI